MFKGAVWMPCFIEESMVSIFGPEFNIKLLTDKNRLEQTYNIEGLCNVTFVLDKVYEFNTVRSVREVIVNECNELR